MSKIKNISSIEILDSRGNPTLKTTVELECGGIGVASVPSGASTGKREALELRDHNPDRYFGKGVQNAVNHVNSQILKLLKGEDSANQAHIDQLMIDLDGTDNKENLGANAILSVSIATCRASANSQKIPLYQRIANIAGSTSFSMPLPMMNILNGGSHADNNIDIQEFMIQPVGAQSMSQALQMGAEVFHTLKKVLKTNKLNTSVGDEGGFAPDLQSNEEAIELIVEAVETAGYAMQTDFTLAIDCASSEFFHSGYYHIDGKQLTTEQFIDYTEDLCQRYPIASIEDLIDESDWDGWKQATERLGNKIQLVGDDLFVTNPKILQKGIDGNIANAILIKYNQIGTITETIEAIQMAKNNGYATVVSHRSGETSDTTIADLAVGLAAGQIKTGSLCRTDRIAKYNRLLEISHDLSAMARYNGIKELSSYKPWPMAVFLIVFAIMAIIISIMAVGVIAGRKPISGSCGGVANALNEKDYTCPICGDDKSECVKKDWELIPLPFL